MSEVRVIKIDVGKKPTDSKIENSLEAFQAYVNGFIEVHPLKSVGLYMVMNEEGSIHQLPRNVEASKLFGSLIVGNAILTRYNTDGDNIDLTDEDVKKVISYES
jgi:hypothetical protein